ncbi:MAG: secretin N-terminal domain-containing protein [Sedimentisphaerales bacterium]
MNIADVFAAQSGEQNSQLVRVRIFTLRNISAEQAKEYLAASQIADTVVVIPNTTAISVAGKPEELVYATNILKLVDSNETYDVKMFDIEQGKSLPLPVEIEKKLGSGYSVGSLMDGPVLGAGVKTIISIHKDKLLIIASGGQKAKITEVVLSSLISSKPAIAEPNIAVAEPNIATEPNLPVVESKVEISVNGKAQTEEDKLLAEFVSELTSAPKAENLKTAELQYKAITAHKEVEPKPAEQTQIAEAAVESTEKIQELAVSERPQVEVKDANVLLAAVTGEANQPETIEVKPSAIPVIDIPNGDEELTLNLPEKLEIVALIDLVGKYLNLNYLYDELKVTGAVTIKVQGKLKVRQLYDILESVLKFRGFVMSRKGNLVTIVPVAEALDQDPTFAGDIKAGDVIVTKIFKLQYITTTAAKQLLIGMKLGTDLTITPIVESGSLVITEYAFRMQRIEDLLSIVDVPGPPKEFKLRVLKYTLAESLVPKIQALAEQLGTVNVTVGTTSTQSVSPMSRARQTRTPQPAQPTPAPVPTQDTSAKTGVFIDFDKRTNRVLMIGLADELVAVNQIIDSLDVPQQDLRSIREYEIQYVDIESVVTALRDFGIIDSTTGGSSGGGNSFTNSSRIRQQQQQQNPQQPQAAINQAISGDGGALSLSAIDQPQVVVLESTNSILVNATPEQQLQIARIISYMDREPISNAIPYKIYRLENQEPEDLAEVLNNFIEKTVKDKEGKIQSTTKFQEDIVVVPDKNTFSLIVYASKKKQEWIGSLIKTLDTRRPQVLIDVSLVEVTRNDAFQFDLDLVTNAKDFVTNNIGTTTAALNAATGDHIEAKLDSGTTHGYYSADRIQALLKLVNTKGYGRVLAQPKILVNDNAEGTIETTNKTYVSEETQSYPGTTTGSTPIPVTTQTWKDYSAKIKLAITPQISEGELLRLEIEMTREDFGNQPAGAPPDMTTSNVKTVVTVPNGSTIILGGLNKLNQSKSGGKTPLLGDIPVAGALFRKVDNSNKESRLYVFVKANISRPDALSSLNQLKAISKKNQTEFEKMEDKFQEHEDFPGVKPTPMEPLKVLEQDVNEVAVNNE